MKCKNCKYLIKQNDKSLSCRANPPTPLPMETISPLGVKQLSVLPLFSPTTEENFCRLFDGLHEAKIYGN